MRGVISEGGQKTQRVRETTCEGERDHDCERQRVRGVMGEREWLRPCSQRIEGGRDRRERKNECAERDNTSEGETRDSKCV